MTTLPTGTVTFLFTDLEGQTQLWEEHPAAWAEGEAMTLEQAVAHALGDEEQGRRIL